MAFQFAPSLELLNLYLKQKGIDTSKITSDRHALHLLIKHTGMRIKFPKRGEKCYNALRRLHRDLFPNVPMKRGPSRPRRVRGIGQTGPASDCRTVTSEVFAEIAAKYDDAVLPCPRTKSSEDKTPPKIAQIAAEIPSKHQESLSSIKGTKRVQTA